jgi:hypothetical protein
MKNGVLTMRRGPERGAVEVRKNIFLPLAAFVTGRKSSVGKEQVTAKNGNTWTPDLSASLPQFEVGGAGLQTQAHIRSRDLRQCGH